MSTEKTNLEEKIHEEQIKMLLRGERPFYVDENGEKVYMRWDEFKVKRRMVKKIVNDKMQGSWVHKATEIKFEDDGNGNKKEVIISNGTYKKKKNKEE